MTNDFGNGLSSELFMVGAGKYYNKFQDSRDMGAQYSEVEYNRIKCVLIVIIF